VTFYVHVVAESNDNLLDLLNKLTAQCEDESLGVSGGQVELLEDGYGEGCNLASTGIGLSNDIVTLDDGNNRTLLDSGRVGETLGEKCQR